MSNGDERIAALEKKAAEAEDSFAAMARMLEERKSTLRVKEAQLFEAMERLKSVEEKAVVDTKELRLVSSEPRQRLDEQKEEDLRLTASVEAMRQGEGLDYNPLIQTPTFEEIR